MLKLRRSINQTLQGAPPSCESPRILPLAPCVPPEDVPPTRIPRAARDGAQSVKPLATPMGAAGARGCIQFPRLYPYQHRAASLLRPLTNHTALRAPPWAFTLNRVCSHHPRNVSAHALSSPRGIGILAPAPRCEEGRTMAAPARVPPGPGRRHVGPDHRLMW